MSLSASLFANALFSLVCSLICLLAGGFVQHHTGIPSQIWISGLGLMLLAYVPILLFAALHPHDWLVRTIILLDWGFVIIASIWLVFSWQSADAWGIALAIIPTTLVGLLAILQQRGLSRQIEDRSE